MNSVEDATELNKRRDEDDDLLKKIEEVPLPNQDQNQYSMENKSEYGLISNSSKVVVDDSEYDEWGLPKKKSLNVIHMK
jgi:hypothetical protein